MWFNTKSTKDRVDQVKARTHNQTKKEQKAAIEKSLEEGWEEIEKCVLTFKAGRNILEGGRFDTSSLGTWMEIVKAVDITYIPAYIIGLAQAVGILKNKAPLTLLNIPEELLKYQGCVRLDSCASKTLKETFTFIGDRPEQHIYGALEENGKFYFEWDERTTNALLKYVGQIEKDGNSPQPIWWRPWVKALEVEVFYSKDMGRGSSKWPMEWRVYVQKGKIAAISAYYIQAPVILSPIIKEHIKSVIDQTNLVLNFMKDKNIQPWHPRYIGSVEEDDTCFSFDFISTKGGPAFLEAGPRVPVDENNVPAYEWGAHPCFFIGKEVKGVALNKDLVLDIEDFV